jgi:antirestriction protein ArdC
MTTTKTPEQRTQELADAHDMIVQAVGRITSDKQWRAWLNTLGKFHSYSFNNVLLLHMQCAARGMDAPSRVAGFKVWLSLNRCVIKGEKALKVYAPIVVKIKPGERGYRPDGTATKVAGFRLAPTFDIQQTDGEPLPEEPETPEFPAGVAPDGLWESQVKFAKDHGYDVSFGNTNDAEGYTDPQTHDIVISNVHDTEGLYGRACAILSHEIAHMLLHVDGDADEALRQYRSHRGVAETEAESIAYLVSRHFGIAVGATSFHYVAGWAKDPDVVIKVGQRVQSTARKIIDALDASVRNDPFPIS